MPLSNIKVIDLTRARSGPTCVRQLSEMGAQVIKVELPGSEDLQGRHHFDFQNLHPNKRSITIDLKHPKGKEVLLRLVKDADVVVENFRPNVKHRLGIDYEALSQINPRLVYTSISGFGQEGPDEDRPGLDQIAQGMSGVMTVNGEPGRGPMRVGLPIADLTAGFMAAYGTVCALYERERSGRGQWVHTSLLQAMVRLMDFQGARYLLKGEVPKQEGNNHPIQSPTNVYQASDGMIIIQASGNSMFRKLCEVIDAPELLEDERYKTVSSRFQNHHELDAQISGHTSKRTVSEWIELLTEAGVPSGPIYNVQQCFENEQVGLLPLAVPLESPALGPIKIMGYGVNLQRTPPRHRSSTPEQGEHTDEVLAELGYSAGDIAELHSAGAV